MQLPLTLTFSFCRSTEDAGLSLTSADNKSLISLRKLPQCYWWNHSDSTLVVIALLLAPSRAALAKCHSVPLVLIMAAVSSEESHRLSCSYWGLPALESSCLVWLWPAGPASPRWHDSGMTSLSVPFPFQMLINSVLELPRAACPPSALHFCHLPKSRWFLFTCFFNSHSNRIQTILI